MRGAAVRHVGAGTGITVRAPRLRCLAAGASGIFPLGRARQAIAMAAARRQPLHVGDRIVPRHTGHGVTRRLHEARLLPAGRGLSLPPAIVDVTTLHVPPCRRRELTEFPHGHLIGRYRERVVEPNHMLWSLERQGMGVARRRSLLEAPCRQHRHRRTCRAVVQHRTRLGEHCRHCCGRGGRRGSRRRVRRINQRPRSQIPPPPGREQENCGKHEWPFLPRCS